MKRIEDETERPTRERRRISRSASSWIARGREGERESFERKGIVVVVVLEENQVAIPFHIS